MGFSGQEHWSVLPFPSPVDLYDPRIEPGSSALQADSLPFEPPGKSCIISSVSQCFIDYAKAFDCVDHNKLWKILKEMEIPDHLTCHCMQVRKQQLELDMEQTSSKSGKEYVKAVYCHPAYLTYMQRTS